MLKKIDKAFLLTAIMILGFNAGWELADRNFISSIISLLFVFILFVKYIQVKEGDY